MMKRPVLVALVLTTGLAGAVCSRQKDQPGSEGSKPAAAANLAAADMGGAVESVSNMYGPGFTGRRLIDGLLDPTWKVTEKLADESMYPHDIVISFFERQPATIESVVLVLAEDVTMAPKDVEVWTSPNDLQDGL